VNKDNHLDYLPLYTTFELIVAQNLAYYRNRDEPTEQDLQDAVAWAAKWNNKRIKLGFRAWQ